MFMTNMDEVTTRNGQPSARSLSSLVRDYCRKLDEVLEDSSWSWTCASAATERMAGVSEPLFTYISQAKDSRDQPTDKEEQALASLREFLNRRDPNGRTRLNFSEYDAGTSFSAWDIHFDRTKSDVLEFGPNSSNSSMTDACGDERQAHSKEAPGMSPVINSSVNHKGTDPRPKHRITSDTCNHSEKAPSKSAIINLSMNYERRDPCLKHHCGKHGRNKNRTEQRKRDASGSAEKNQKAATKNRVGSRKVLNRTPNYAPDNPNDRTCLADSICSLLDDRKRSVIYADIVREMPSEGDTSVGSANVALVKHDLKLERVSGLFRRKGGIPFHLLQLRRCKLVLLIELTTLEGGSAFHSVAWDGTTIWDRPHKVIVNKSTDRKTAKACLEVFKRLYHKKFFKSWHINGIYKLTNRDILLITK